jgi:hypothetical protein
MKYLLILLLSFGFFSPALAANTVKGSVPKVQSLQPLPQGISPAYNKNIQYQDPNYQNAPGNTTPGVDQKTDNTASNHNDLTEHLSATVSQSAPTQHYIWWLVILLLAIIVGFWVYKRRNAK